MPNCSSPSSLGSRWVWSMPALLTFTSSSEASWCRRFQLFEHEPIISRLAGRVRAVPILEYDAVKALRLQRVTPGSQPARDVGRQPHIRAGREDAFQVPPPLEKRDLQKRLAVDLKQIEGREDLPGSELPRVRVGVLVHFEIALVLPTLDEDAVDDRSAALGLGDDRVVKLARPHHFYFVTDEMRLWAAVPDEAAGARPRPLEDVAIPLRSFAD